MAFDFPTNPTNGQVYNNFYWDSSTSAWRNLGSKNALSSAVTALQAKQGKVLQVVTSTYTAGWSTTSTEPVNTGLSATITPKYADSKILLMVNLSGITRTGSSNAGFFRVMKNGTFMYYPGYYMGHTPAMSGTMPYFQGMSTSSMVLETAGTTSPITYLVQAWALIADTLEMSKYNAASSITIMEIAA